MHNKIFISILIQIVTIITLLTLDLIQYKCKYIQEIKMTSYQISNMTLQITAKSIVA